MCWARRHWRDHLFFPQRVSDYDAVAPGSGFQRNDFDFSILSAPDFRDFPADVRYGRGVGGAGYGRNFCRHGVLAVDRGSFAVSGQLCDLLDAPRHPRRLGHFVVAGSGRTLLPAVSLAVSALFAPALVSRKDVGDSSWTMRPGAGLAIRGDSVAALDHELLSNGHPV